MKNLPKAKTENLTREDILNQSRKFFAEFFEQNKEKGLLSVYLWGSIITDDYIPIQSDIDAIGIIDSSAKESDFVTDKAALAKFENVPPHLGFRVLYLDELETGMPRSWMGGVLHPRWFLLEFPLWLHMAGKNYQRADFPIQDLTKEETVRYRIEEVTTRYAEELHQRTPKAHYYLCKSLFRICYYLDQLNTSYPFSYTAVYQHRNGDTAKIVEALMAIRNSGWSVDEFEKNRPMFDHFIASLKKRYKTQ